MKCRIILLYRLIFRLLQKKEINKMIYINNKL